MTSGYRDDVVTISIDLWRAIAECLVITGDGRLMTATGLVDLALSDAQLDELTRLGVEP